MSDNKHTGPEKSAQEKFDQEFDAFLHEGDSRVAALYRKLPHAEPDAQLDARVRVLAQRVLREQPAVSLQPATRRRANWLPIFGTAAVLIVAAGLASRMAPQIWSSRTATEPADAASATGTVVASPAAPAAEPLPAAAQNAASAASASVAADNSLARSERENKAAAPSEALRAAKPKSVDAPKPAPAPPPFPGGSGELRKERAAVAPPTSKPIAVDKIAPAPEPVQSAQRFSAPATAAAADAVQSEPPVPAAMSPAPAPPPPPASAAPSIAPPPAEIAPPAAAPTQSISGAAAAPEQAQRLQRQSDVPTELEKKRSDALELPEHWIARIRVLLRQRQYDTALRNLHDFRRDYPNYELPADLRDLK